MRTDNKSKRARAESASRGNPTRANRPVPARPKGARLLLAAVCAGLLFVTAACSSADASGGSDGEITIGLIADLTGTGATDAVPFAAGAKTAVDDLNQAGGIDGRKVNLVVEDDKSNAATAIGALTTLTSVHKVNIIICECSSQIFIPVAERAKSMPDVTLVNAGAGTSEIAELAKITVSTIPTNDVLAQALAQMAWDNGVRKVAILGQNDAYGTDLAKGLGKAWEKLGGTVLASKILDPEQNEYTTEMRSIDDVDPDAILSSTYGPAAALQFKAITAQGSEAPWYNLYPEYSAQAELPSSTNRVYGLEPGWSADSDPGAAERIGTAIRNGPVGYFAANGYDTTQLTAKVAASVKSSSVSAVKEAFRTIGATYTGLTGGFKFDDEFVRSNSSYVTTVAKDAKMVPFTAP